LRGRVVGAADGVGETALDDRSPVGDAAAVGTVGPTIEEGSPGHDPEPADPQGSPAHAAVTAASDAMMMPVRALILLTAILQVGGRRQRPYGARSSVSSPAGGSAARPADRSPLPGIAPEADDGRFVER
jgi:hypothetical protein